jgi:Tol biopolymer transport system component
MSRKWRRQVLSVLVAGLVASGCTWIVRASVNDAGEPGNFTSGHSPPSISGDGRYVAFDSTSTNLVPGDLNSIDDIFVRDTRVGTTLRVSVDADGGDSNNNSGEPSISADGRYVAFRSGATDLVPGGTPSGGVFVRDLQSATTELVAGESFGDLSIIEHLEPSISANGRFVAFTTVIVDRVGSAEDIVDIYVRDLDEGTTTRVNVDANGGDANDISGTASISADGRYVAFDSYASDLVANDSGQDNDVFVRDMQASTTTRVSLDTAGGEPNNQSSVPSISAEGRYVVFSSAASDLVPADGTAGPGGVDVFVRDLQLATTSRASVDTAGGDPDGPSGNLFSGGPSISADGRYVAFSTAASDLVPDDGNSTHDVVVRDLATRTTTLASAGALGEQANDLSGGPSISADGRYVAFKSFATNLAGQEIGADWDVFVRAVVTPMVDSVKPATLRRGDTKTLRIRGTGFIAPMRVLVPEAVGVTVQSVTVISETRLRATVNVAANAEIGSHDVVVFPHGTGPGALSTGAAVCAGCLTII